MRRTDHFVVRSSYNAARDSETRRGTDTSRLTQDYETFLDAEYYPTNEECQQLASPIAVFLTRCTCYDMLGTSTQVVVLNIDVALTVAFIAAQETRLNSCVLWDPIAHTFCGTLSSTDYIEILLYCHHHPDEREKVGCYTIRQWREKKQKSYSSSGSGSGGGDKSNKKNNNNNNNNNSNNNSVKKQSTLLGEEPSTSSFSSYWSIPTFITCAPDTPISDCLQRLLRHNVRRIVVLTEKEAGDFSVVAILDMQQILVYLGAVFLSIEAAGNGGQGGGRRGSSVGGVSPSVGGSSSSPSDPLNPADTDLFVGDMALPLHVRNLLFAPTDGETENFLMNFGKEPRVGPYRSIFDVPFCYISQLGKHRNHVISITLKSPLLEALQLMLQYEIECIAVVSEEQIIIDFIDRSDIVRIEDQGVYNTQLTVGEALRSKVSGKICVFYPKDTLRDIFVHFVRQRVKELYLVDPETDKLIGQLNIAELVFFLVFGITMNYDIEENNSHVISTTSRLNSSSTSVAV